MVGEEREEPGGSEYLSGLYMDFPCAGYAQALIHAGMINYAGGFFHFRHFLHQRTGQWTGSMIGSEYPAITLRGKLYHLEKTLIPGKTFVGLQLVQDPETDEQGTGQTSRETGEVQ